MSGNLPPETVGDKLITPLKSENPGSLAKSIQCIVNNYIFG